MRWRVGLVLGLVFGALFAGVYFYSLRDPDVNITLAVLGLFVCWIVGLVLVLIAFRWLFPPSRR